MSKFYINNKSKIFRVKSGSYTEIAEMSAFYRKLINAELKDVSVNGETIRTIWNQVTEVIFDMSVFDNKYNIYYDYISNLQSKINLFLENKSLKEFKKKFPQRNSKINRRKSINICPLIAGSLATITILTISIRFQKVQTEGINLGPNTIPNVEFYYSEVEELGEQTILKKEMDILEQNVNFDIPENSLAINNYEEETGFCHIVASKSCIIKSVSTKKGVSLVNTNDYVSKDEILISGEIKFNEEVKNNVCASGEVYAEVWYNINASVPLNYKEEIRTGKMRYNFSIKTNTSEFVILKSRVKDKQVEKKLLFKIFGISFYLEKEYEVTVTNKKYTEKDALNKGVKLIHEKLEVRGNKNDDIIDEKVLKKSINNDNLDIDMFVAIKEQIGKKISYEVELDSDTNDEKNNGNSN